MNHPISIFLDSGPSLEIHDDPEQHRIHVIITAGSALRLRATLARHEAHALIKAIEAQLHSNTRQRPTTAK